MNCAGDLGCTVKLKGSHSNQTLNPKGNETKIKRIQFPTPRVRMAVMPPSKSEVEKMANALHAIQEEDPTLLVEQSVEPEANHHSGARRNAPGNYPPQSRTGVRRWIGVW
ncbi:MAG: hypothetical protein R2792_07555 [Saprospiraceae bacterium]